MDRGHLAGPYPKFGRYWDVKNIAVSLGVFFGILLLGWLFDRQQTRLESMEQLQKAEELGAQLGRAIESEMNSRLIKVEALVAYQATGMELDQSSFDSFARPLDEGDQYAMALQLAPDGVVAYSTQIERNASAIGHDLLADPARAEMAYKSIETGEYLIIGPINLIQGGTALIARKPIYTNDQVGMDSFWGFATVIVNFEAITHLISGSGAFATHNFALRDDHSHLWGEASVFNLKPCLATINLAAAGTWTLAVAPKVGWSQTWPHSTYFRIVIIGVALAISSMLFVLLNKPKQLRQAVVSATKELTENEKKLREAHKIAQLGSWEMNAEGTVGWSDEALDILGIEGPRLSSRLSLLYAMVHEDDVEELQSKFENTQRPNLKFEHSFRLLGAQKAKQMVKLTALTRLGGDGQLVIEGTLQDVTSEHFNAERLRRAQKLEAIGQLTGGVAHDFNNLLAVIKGNSELMEMGGKYDQDLLNEIHQASRKGAALTHRLLAYARKQPLAPRATDLGDLVQGMYPILSRSIGEEIRVELQFEPDLWPARVDPSQIEDAILNLAINARDAMTCGGRLLIKTCNVDVDKLYQEQISELAEGQYVLLEVTDTGIGMSEDVRDRAFEPFFTTKGLGNGSGLGLSMVSGLARQSGGGVDITSEEGNGTTVRIYLPRSEQAAKEETVVPFQPAVEAPSGNRETILVVEDNSAVRHVVAKALDRLGYATIQADTAKAAGFLFENNSDVDLVLSDIVLPGGVSGLDFAESLRAKGHDIPVVLMSGFPDSRTVSSQETLNTYNVLKKPFTHEQLSAALSEALGNQTLRSPMLQVVT